MESTLLDIYKISYSHPPYLIVKGDDVETCEELREMFLKKHREWEEVNTPSGHVSGEVWKKWEERLQVLLNLVRKEQSLEKYEEDLNYI